MGRLTGRFDGIVLIDGATRTADLMDWPVQIKETVGKIMKDLRTGKRFKEGQVLEVWPEVVGKRVARHTRPVMVRGGRLLVNVDGSVWLYELTQRYRGRLLKRLQKKVGAETLKEIQFRVGEV